jgi:probable poly-beta-1,6-N-acetyl-D-glucosamine export protein
MKAVNYLSRENTNILKGICAVMVVLHHVCSRTGTFSEIGLGPIYTAMGYWAVSVFMFVSGYGLMCSLTKSPHSGGVFSDLSW